MNSFDEAIAIIAQTDPQKAEELKNLRKAEQAKEDADARLKALEDEKKENQKRMSEYLRSGQYKKDQNKFKGRDL